MFTYRLCDINDKDCWIAMNREFMAEEIQDEGLWNSTGNAADDQFSNTFMEALEYVERFAASQGYKRLQFQSETTNPNAMEFYVSQGYNPADMKFYVKYFDYKADKGE